MSHTKHHTNAIILRSVGTGEADKFIWALSREFGMVGFHARSIRKISSKQRCYLEPLSYARLSLVRGRNMWRLTNVSEAGQGFRRGPESILRARTRTVSLVSRLVHGEESHPDLFSTIYEGFSFFDKAEISDMESYYLENLIYLRVLSLLGYVEKEKEIAGLLEDLSLYDRGVLDNTIKKDEAVRFHISRALESSGL